MYCVQCGKSIKRSKLLEMVPNMFAMQKFLRPLQNENLTPRLHARNYNLYLHQRETIVRHNVSALSAVIENMGEIFFIRFLESNWLHMVEKHEKRPLSIDFFFIREKRNEWWIYYDDVWFYKCCWLSDNTEHINAYFYSNTYSTKTIEGNFWKQF